MRILIIGPLGGLPGHAADLLRELGIQVDQATSVASGLALMQYGDLPDLVLCALTHDVAGLVAVLRQEQPALPVIACGPQGQSGAEALSLALGAAAYLPLPADSDALTAMLATVSAREPTEAMVFRDPAMAEVMRRVDHVAASNATVLIMGESGTGKELVAARLHRRSGRQGRPFVALNCAAIPDALLESELFGHEKGAFSGATCRRVGKFEAASGGTLLLDEIGDMDLRMQVKLLRAVQQREIDRVGGSRPVAVDVRIIATTNRNLQEEVRLGRFRADLFFRLNVITVKLPPLRERPGDIAMLAEFFARKFAQLNGRTAAAVSPAALAALQRYDWPGNVRELENVIHRAVLTQSGSCITPAALDLDTADTPAEAAPAPLPFEAPMPLAAHAGFTMPQGAVHTSGRTIEAVEKDMILDTLCQCKGNRAQTAAVLGISIRTLRNKLQEYERTGTRIPRPVVVAVA
jgi:DNA-binding NtrC family response regulator